MRVRWPKRAKTRVQAENRLRELEDPILEACLPSHDDRLSNSQARVPEGEKVSTLQKLQRPMRGEVAFLRTASERTRDK
jgi:hypothetical protein